MGEERRRIVNASRIFLIILGVIIAWGCFIDTLLVPPLRKGLEIEYYWYTSSPSSHNSSSDNGADNGGILVPTGDEDESVSGNTPLSAVEVIRVKYQLREGRPNYEGWYNWRHICKIEHHPTPLPFASSLLLDNTTPEIETDLKVVMMGDSVAMQIAGAYQKAIGGNNKVVQMEKRFFDVITHTDSHSGHVAGFRLTHMLLPENRNKSKAPTKGGGWGQTQVDMILSQANNTIAMDALVFRIPQGVWMSPHPVTLHSLNQTTLLSHELFKVSVVTFLTFPICNNYRTLADIQLIRKKNQLIHDFANDWNTHNKQRDLPFVFVVDFGDLVIEASKLNAEHLGFEDPTADSVLISHRIGTTKWTQPGALVCAKPPTNNSKNGNSCEKNRLSADGMHICKYNLVFFWNVRMYQNAILMFLQQLRPTSSRRIIIGMCLYRLVGMEAFAGRLLAAISCQHACLFNTVKSLKKTEAEIIKCSKKCNDDYMTLSSSSTVFPVVDDQQVS